MKSIFKKILDGEFAVNVIGITIAAIIPAITKIHAEIKANIPPIVAKLRPAIPAAPVAPTAPAVPVAPTAAVAAPTAVPAAPKAAPADPAILPTPDPELLKRIKF